MKFGGASLASRNSILRVSSIIRSQLSLDPVVVVSALGDTTDHLLDILTCASQANVYGGWKSLARLQTYHFCLAEDLLHGPELDEIKNYLRQLFRDLHIYMRELCEGERILNPELQDWVLSLGEQIASKIVTSTLRISGIPAVHIDGRKVIVTDEHFSDAQPSDWSTYARVRCALAGLKGGHVPIIGGFIAPPKTDAQLLWGVAGQI